ncbi:hypothetical protein Csa_004882 [Cucumis sativus]|uniref:1-deoxy-D-xylulose-5-phosphate synthase n=1 Tax=Cucumis sativus TaxID=3659 RepID=A0A0A0KB43_CUCSA|nr:hypothetical protein Csa_004882 [Cucumis sativus]
MAKLGAQGHSVSWFCDFPLWLHDAVSLSLPGGVSYPRSGPSGHRLELFNRLRMEKGSISVRAIKMNRRNHAVTL